MTEGNTHRSATTIKPSVILCSNPSCESQRPWPVGSRTEDLWRRPAVSATGGASCVLQDVTHDCSGAGSDGSLWVGLSLWAFYCVTPTHSWADLQSDRMSYLGEQLPSGSATVRCGWCASFKWVIGVKITSIRMPGPKVSQQKTALYWDNKLSVVLMLCLIDVSFHLDEYHTSRSHHI